MQHMAFPAVTTHVSCIRTCSGRLLLNICSWCRHKHEIETGRTSSLSHHLLGYDAQDYVINYAGVAAPAPADIAADADKVWCVTGRAALQCLLMTHSEPVWL